MLTLIIGPGDAQLRALIYDRALSQPNLFSGIVKPMGRQWATIFSRDLLTSAQAQNLTFETQSNNVALAWSDFQGSQLPALIKAVLAIDEDLTTPSS